MKRLVTLEFLKLRHSRAMWILLALYGLALIASAFSGMWILEFLESKGVEFRGITPTVLPIYDFVDIWQNLTYVASYFKIFPAFLLIISVSNEYTYKTNRQNIIDGLSRAEFFYSKLAFAAFLSIISALLILFLGLGLGFTYSDVTNAASVFENIGFVGAHALQLFLFFVFAILLVLLIKRSGFTIVFLLLYSAIIEPILVLILSFDSKTIAAFLPVNAMNNLVQIPFAKFLFMYTQDYVGLQDVAIALGWSALFTTLIFLILKKRDF